MLGKHLPEVSVGIVCITIFVLLTSGCFTSRSYSVTSPIYPPMNFSVVGIPPDQHPKINTLEPELQWKDARKTSGQTYDLCIWRARPTGEPRESWGTVVFYHENIETNCYKVPKLRQYTDYNWSVRLRSGQKVGRWSAFSQGGAYGPLTISQGNVPFGFETPVVAPTIFEAAESDDLARVKFLLKGDPNLINNRDSRYEGTPLHWAAAKNSTNVTQLLLDNNADVNATNTVGETPLHLAALNGHKELTELLLANKADVNAKAKDGATPLHYAAKGGNRAVVELLVDGSTDVNAKDNNGSTPLHLALDGARTDVAEFLRQHGGQE